MEFDNFSMELRNYLSPSPGQGMISIDKVVVYVPQRDRQSGLDTSLIKCLTIGSIMLFVKLQHLQAGQRPVTLHQGVDPWMSDKTPGSIQHPFLSRRPFIAQSDPPPVYKYHRST